MISTCTLFVRTKVTPRWMALLGYILALLLLVSISRLSWIILVFPLWILLISVHILIENFRRKPDDVGAASAGFSDRYSEPS